MKKNQLKKNLAEWFLFWSAVGIGCLILIFLVTTTWIGVDIHTRCTNAENIYKTDCVSALVQVVGDESKPLRDRNQAIWTLGQLGDPKAKPALEELYTGNIPNREPYDETISQYELKKALNLLNGGKNLTRFVWKTYTN